jgi:hypothetical protein
MVGARNRTKPSEGSGGRRSGAIVEGAPKRRKTHNPMGQSEGRGDAEGRRFEAFGLGVTLPFFESTTRHVRPENIRSGTSGRRIGGHFALFRRSSSSSSSSPFHIHFLVFTSSSHTRTALPRLLASGEARRAGRHLSEGRGVETGGAIGISETRPRGTIGGPTSRCGPGPVQLPNAGGGPERRKSQGGHG